jgi:hypothetical protein
MQADAIQIAKRAAAEMGIRSQPAPAEREEAALDKNYQSPNGPEDYGLSADGGRGADIEREQETTGQGTASTSAAPRFVPIAIDDVTMSAEPAWLIDGILPARGLACIVGPPKSGKSFLTSDMLCSVARGALYASRATMQGPVVYLTGEGVSGFKRRLVAMRRHHGIEGKGIPFYMIENVPDLGSERTDLPMLIKDLDDFIAQRAPGGVRAIVLDTLARCMGEADENSARDMGRFVNRCSAIERHYGCLVVVVHHVGKDASRGGRGSNSLNGAADVTMLVEKTEAYSKVRIDEMKDGREGQEWRFKLVPYVLTETSETPTETCSETSTCVVELLSEPSQAKPASTKAKKPPTGVVGDLLKVIRRSIEESGETNVDSLAVPNNVRAVSRANLKRYCATMAWQEQDDKPDAFRSMLSKTLSGLRSLDLIGFDKSWVWLI